jgi:tetratricopeptide (TPR) repeat protein
MEQAEADFEKALEVDPRHGDALNNRGCVRWAKQDADAALDDFLKAMSLNPNHAAAYKNAATVYIAKNRMNDAIQILEQAVRVQPGDTEVVVALCEAWLSQNKWQKALALLERSLKKPVPRQQRSRMLTCRARAVEQSGNVKKALKSYQQALEATDDPSIRASLENKIAEISALGR